MKQKQYRPFSNNKKLQKVIDEREENHIPQGLNGTELSEAIPAFNILSCEKAIQGKNNTWIVMGRDRNASKKSVNLGNSQAGAIDIVVGRGSALNLKPLLGKSAPPGKDTLLDPNFFADAARIYITQKGSTDKYFGLAIGTEKTVSKNCSAIGIKADHVRIVGRNHIKIVTGRAQMEGGGFRGERNAKGGFIENTGRIDLIAGNYTKASRIGLMAFAGVLAGKQRVQKLQPIPKGDNLLDCLNEMTDLLEELLKLVGDHGRLLVELSGQVGGHSHEIVVPTSPGSLAAMPSPHLAGSMVQVAAKLLNRQREKIQSRYNIAVFRTNYLTKGASAKYINSGHVSTT